MTGRKTPETAPPGVEAPSAPSDPVWVGDELLTLVADPAGEPLVGLWPDGGLFHYERDGRLPEQHRFTDPFNHGNAWMAIEDRQGTVRYMSDQWGGRLCGFERRQMPVLGDIHIAQTHSPALGMLAFGGGSMMVRREGGNLYPYHHLASDYGPGEARIGAGPAAQIFLRMRDARHRALPTVLTGGLMFGSGLYRDTAVGSSRMNALREELRRMTAQARAIGKELWVDRVLLSLFEGVDGSSLGAASYEYGMAMRHIREIVAQETGQPRAPALVVSQSAGGRDRGDSAVILAEAQLDIDHWSLGAIVASPKYHLPLAPGSHSALTPAGAAWLSEIEAVAVETVLNGGQWYCPRLTHALLDGTTITGHFMANNDQELVLEDAEAHGFTLLGEVGEARITAIAIEGLNLRFTLSAPPAGAVRLAYAFGGKGDGTDRAANRGTLRDRWGRQALHDPEVTLRRYALSAAVPVVRK